MVWSYKKMYKVIHNDIIIDVLEKIEYRKFLSTINKLISANEKTANCILASNNSDLYCLDNMIAPKEINCKIVTLEEISKSEYDNLVNLLANKTIILADGTFEIEKVKAEKIKEMSAICHKNIINGITIILSDKKKHHFKFTIEDQINLLSIKNEIDNGAKKVIYHETNGEYTAYSSKDMLLLFKSFEQHKMHHLIYFNELKRYINNLDDIEKIKNIKYGLKLYS